MTSNPQVMHIIFKKVLKYEWGMVNFGSNFTLINQWLCFHGVHE